MTNVLSPEQLSAQELCDLYRRRWQIESAFLLTKRLLELGYLWVGHRQGVQIQILATLIFYPVLNPLVGQVAMALSQPKEKISVAMVFPSLYYVAKAVTRGENPDVVSYLAKRAKLFGLVKAERKRHRERDALSQEIGGLCPSVDTNDRVGRKCNNVCLTWNDQSVRLERVLFLEIFKPDGLAF
ncbi:hypothetical protein MiYa_00258 [Microcystis aeruginosa NIES-2519]|jgi:hypothetical protein|uniref:Transposase IS4-like domain-containing protein n=1 Tax=Microcystis aeruginosa NIES-2519 TaxID=2303981 RepID=A0A5A5R693_MICAE|nr:MULTISPECIES: hypothetical protein [Microcystis]AVQ70892.1 hypothetical protein B5D77_05735 [Microcystis sp. MC19]GCA68742.1 hypothetical protein MiYa_00258 [Microcystis aeruginosa NIES-2519]GCA85466.1 hypothetical protein MiHa_03449 [Microcystis aeruginosa NIES-2522]CCI33728.1 hypothetical protein MICAI_430034 [Microcystis sp. T1-4]